jgi:hypothetical protein
MVDYFQHDSGLSGSIRSEKFLEEQERFCSMALVLIILSTILGKPKIGISSCLRLDDFPNNR